MARELAGAVARLAMTAEDRARPREALLGLLARETDPGKAREVADVVAGLNPRVADLVGSDSWPFPPNPAMLAAARQNSGLPAWLAALLLLSSAVAGHVCPVELSGFWRCGRMMGRLRGMGVR
jgi:hypothetical protein